MASTLLVMKIFSAFFTSIDCRWEFAIISDISSFRCKLQFISGLCGTLYFLSLFSVLSPTFYCRQTLTVLFVDYGVFLLSFLHLCLIAFSVSVV